jgi:hypothetical protein
MMKEIYKNANRVVAWLDGSYDAPLVAGFIFRVAQFFLAWTAPSSQLGVISNWSQSFTESLLLQGVDLPGGGPRKRPPAFYRRPVP